MNSSFLPAFSLDLSASASQTVELAQSFSSWAGEKLPSSVTSSGIPNAGTDNALEEEQEKAEQQQQSISERRHMETTNASKPIATVAYVISITGCTRGFAKKIYDFGAVLKKSIDLNSFPQHPTSRYASKAFVLLTPETKNSQCAKRLKRAGFQPHLVNFPVKVEQIQDVKGASRYKKLIRTDGCCGEKELIKLHVYSMTDFPVAIHLDLDTLVVRPLDPVLDGMVFPPDDSTGRAARELLFAPPLQASNSTTTNTNTNTGEFRYPRMATPTYKASVPLEKLDIQAYYTKDYNMVRRGKNRKVGIQGGVIMVRPNITTRDVLVDMVKSGKYYNGRHAESGWFRMGYGPSIHGSRTIQGLLAYYYTEVAHDSSVELNRCRFNQIAENPRRSSFDKRGMYPRGTPFSPDATFGDMDCRDRGGKKCDDVQCQTWPIEESFILHYTYCKTPIKCMDGAWNETYKDHHCKLMFQKWFDVRKLIIRGSTRRHRQWDLLPRMVQRILSGQRQVHTHPLEEQGVNEGIVVCMSRFSIQQGAHGPTERNGTERNQLI